MALDRFHEHGWIFFAWLSDRKCAAAVIPYLKTLPAQVHSPEMIVGSLPEEDWADFAMTYATLKIRSPDGRTINPPVRAELALEPVDGDAPFDLPRETGTLLRHKIDLGEGIWEIEGDGSARAFVSALSDGGDPGGTWQALADGQVEIAVGCGECQGFAVVAFDTTDAAYGYNARRVGSRCELTCAAMSVPRDSCLVGTWVLESYPIEYLNARFI